MVTENINIGRYTLQSAEEKQSRQRAIALQSQLQSLPKGQTLVLDIEQAKDIGYTLPSNDWFLKAYGGGEGLENTYALVSPENWEYSGLQFGEGGELVNYNVKSPEGKIFTMQEFEALQQQAITQPVPMPQPSEMAVTVPITPSPTREFGFENLEPDYQLLFKEYQRTGGQLDIPSWLLSGAPLRPEMESKQVDVAGFQKALEQGQSDIVWDTIAGMGRTQESENLLRTLVPDITEDDIRDFYTVTKVQPYTTDIVHQVFPNMTNEQFDTMVIEDFPAFQRELLKGGRTPEKEDLLLAMGIDWEQINYIFNLPPLFQQALPQFVNESNATFMVDFLLNNPETLRYDLISAGRNKYTLALVMTLIPDITQQQLRDYFSLDAIIVEQKAKEARSGIGAQFTAGVGDLVANIGGIFRWGGFGGIGEKITKFGQFMQVQAKPDDLGEFKWSMLFNPEFYATRVVRSLPTMMTLVIPGIGAYGLASKVAVGVAGRLGLGAFGTNVLSAIGGGVGGAVLSRPLESAMEAANAYDMARNKGLNDREAKDVANQVFGNNMKLVGLDAAQLSVAFMPTPGRVFGNLITKGLVKTAIVGGKLVFTGLTQGGEEFVQEMWQRQALGDWQGLREALSDPEMQQVFAIGALYGIGMGGGGDILQTIQKATINKLSAEQRATFDDTKATFQKKNIDEPVATQLALDEIANTPEGAAIVQDITKAVEQIVAAEMMKPKTAGERIGIQNILKTIINTYNIDPASVGLNADGTIVEPIVKEESKPIPPDVAEKIAQAIPAVTAPEVTIPKVTPQIPIPQTGKPFISTFYRGIKEEGVPPTDEGLMGKATYGSTSEETAATYGRVERSRVTLNNPFVINSQSEWADFSNRLRDIRERTASEDEAQQVLRNELESEGYDGVVVSPGILEKGYQIAVFYPEKSITPEAVGRLKEGVQLEGGIFGGVYSINQLRFAEKDASIRKTIKVAQEKYNEIRVAQGLKKITDWTKRPEQTLEKIYRAIPKAEVGMPEAGYQPAMIEGVTEREVRPAGKGRVVQISMEDQLKLEQARRQAEAAPEAERKVYEAQVQAESLKATHQADPIAQLRFKIGNRSYSIDNIVDAKEKTFAYNDSFTQSQAKAIKPNVVFSEAQKLPNGRVRADAVLDKLATKYTGGDVNAFIERVNQIRQEKRQIKEYEATIQREMAEQPVSLQKDVEDASDLIKVQGELVYTIEQIDVLSGIVGEYLVNPNTINAYNVLRQYQSLERGRRFKNVAARRQEIMVTEGLAWEEAHNKAMSEFASGKLPSFTVEGLQDITDELRAVFFAKVNYTFDQLGTKYEGERWATMTALANALSGKPIPMDKGKGSLLFPKGGSAWDRLNYVFGKQPTLMQGLTETAGKQQSLKDVVEGVFREVPEGGLPPIPVDQETADYLRNLSLTYDQLKLGALPESLELEVVQDLKSLPSDLKVEDARTQVEKIIDMRRKGLLPAPPVTRYDTPTETTIKQFPLIPRSSSDVLIDALRQLAWAPIDILNGLKSILASVDQSFALRQLLWIAPEIGTKYKQVMVTSWKSGWSQDAADAARVRVNHRIWYQMYEEGVASGRGDPLRMKGIEEFGYVGESQRLISQLFAKIPTTKWSERNYVAGINEGIAVVLDKVYQTAIRKSEKIASGEITLKEGEAFDLKQEFWDTQDFLANATGRATIGRLTPDATFLQAINALFFSLRFKLGRFLMPIHLLGLNKVGKDAHFSRTVMRRAWKDFSIVFGGISSVIALGVLMGWWDTELDRDSPDFLKIRIGKTRIDPWGGMQQIAVFAFQLFDRRAVSTISGKEYPVDLARAVWNMFEKSGSPLTSLAVDLYSGETFKGEPVNLADARQWADRIAPFMTQDIYDFFIEGSDNPGLLPAIAILGWLGTGIYTYTGNWEDDFARLGLPKYFDNGLYGLNEPVYDVKDFWTDTASQFKGVDVATLTARKGSPEYIRAIADAMLINEHLSTLPNKTLVSVNSDPTKGLIIKDYMGLWKQRQALVDSGDDAEFVVKGELQPNGTRKDVTYKGDDAVTQFDKYEHNIRNFLVKGSEARLGNVSQSQFALLTEYWSIESEQEQKDFLKLHEKEIGKVATIEYLRSHTDDNARLAVWGQETPITREAYNKTLEYVKQLGIPDNAIKEYIPPAHIADTHFTYYEKGEEFGYSSKEVKLLILEDYYKAHPSGEIKEGEGEAYLDWRQKGKEPLSLPDEQIEYYKLQIDNKGLYDEQDAINADKTLSPKDKSDKLWEIKQTKVGDQTFADIIRTVDAMGKGTRENPTSQDMIDAFVEYGRIVDRARMTDEQLAKAELDDAKLQEAKLYRYDNPDFNDWGMENFNWKTLSDDKNYLDSYLVPRWRIAVKYMKEESEYNAIPSDNQEARDAYLARHDDYRKDRWRAEALSLSDPISGARFPLDQIENYIQFYELPEKGFRRKRMLATDNAFAQTMINMGKITSIPKLADIPAVGWDETYEANQEGIDELNDLSVRGSTYYIEDEVAREARRNELRYDTQGNPTDLRLAELKLQAYEAKNKKTGERIPERHIDNYVGYNVLSARGYRQERFLMENEDYYNTVWLGVLQNNPIDFSKVPDVEYDNIYDQFKEQFDEWDSYADKNSPDFIQDSKARAKARWNMELADPAFKEARIRQQAYLALIGSEQYVDDYVGYYQLLDKGKPAWWPGGESWYEDDWFKIEHPGWYNAMLAKGIFTEREDFSKVPTREVWNEYMVYQELTGDEERYQYRLTHPELDAWLVLAKGYTKAHGTKAGVKKEITTQAEKIIQDMIEMAERLQAEADEAARSLAEIERRLKGR